MKDQPKSKWSIKQRRARAYNVGYYQGRANGMLYGGIIMFIVMALDILIAHYL